MDHCHFLSSAEEGALESVRGNSGSLLSSDDLQTLENSWVDLVLDTAILSFEILSDNHEVNTFVSAWDIRHFVDVGN